MKATVVICTYNRSNFLQKAISSLQNQDFPLDQYEIVIVDNNSSDNTKEVVNDFIKDSPVKISYIPEKRQGLSFARNTGVDNSSGEIVAFMDDDAEAERQWLASLAELFNNPKVAAAGGPVKPIWHGTKPAWLSEKWIPYLSIREYKELSGRKTFTDGTYPIGTNMSFRKNVLIEVGQFPVILGRRGEDLTSNEEIAVCQKIKARGWKLGFSPEAIVHHHIRDDRLHKEWFYKRAYWQGKSDVVISEESLFKNIFNFFIWVGVIIKNYLQATVSNERASFSSKVMVSLFRGKVSQLLTQLRN